MEKVVDYCKTRIGGVDLQVMKTALEYLKAGRFRFLDSAISEAVRELSGFNRERRQMETLTPSAVPMISRAMHYVYKLSDGYVEKINRFGATSVQGRVECSLNPIKVLTTFMEAHSQAEKSDDDNKQG